MGKSRRNKKKAMENLNLFYPDIRPSSSTGSHLTQEEATKEELALIISQQFALLEEVRPVLETMSYNDKYKKLFNEIWKDKVELDGMIVKEEEEAINKVKGREEIKKVDREITMINHTQAEPMGILMNVLKIPAKSDSSVEETERSIALQAVINPFQNISVWKKAVSFLGSLPAPLQHVDWKPDYKGCYTNEEEAKGQWRTEKGV
ncbi:hypothetical protein Tco_0424193 [Tanacetum coccineum]